MTDDEELTQALLRMRAEIDRMRATTLSLTLAECQILLEGLERDGYSSPEYQAEMDVVYVKIETVMQALVASQKKDEQARLSELDNGLTSRPSERSLQNSTNFHAPNYKLQIRKKGSTNSTS